MTISGLEMKEAVLGLPSFLLAKLRLNDEMMELVVPSAMSSRFHWPMHGPQALARTVAPSFSRTPIWPSRSMVASTCSEPGVTQSGHLMVAPWSRACWATSAARVMSS